MSGLSPGQQVGRYVVGREVGRGAMGVVYAARREDLGRDVALKIMSPDLAGDPGFRARFEHEARILGRLESPHVVQILDVGELDGRPWIATQLVADGDLRHFQRERAGGGGLPAALALDIVRQVAAGVSDAHDAGVVHRDIKPTNVLVRPRDHEVWAWVCDFGIARAAGSDLTLTGDVLGTYRYMAPERHQGRPASVATDVYALGCLLWTTLTGQPPYSGETPYELARAHLEAPVPQLLGTTPLARRVDVILATALAKDPDRRYRTAGDLVAALGQALRLTDGSEGVLGDDPTRVGAETVGGTVGGTADPSEAPTSWSGRPAPRHPVAPSPRRRTPWLLGIAGVLLVVLLAAVVGLAYRDEDPPPASSPTPSPVTTRSTPSTDPSGASCWDGSTAPRPRDCPLPAGRRGFAHVFPSFDRACRSAPLGVPGKLEVFECAYGDYVVRYSRWADGFDRWTYFDEANPGAAKTGWTAGDVRLGTQWLSFEDSPGEREPFQWSATYDPGRPYSVSVEGVSVAARSTGIARVRALAPDLIPVADP